ncbi:hypothetical protein BTO04_09225 [Polaribacter sp. SA4-10]|uniref:DUF3244 domain-containing protein n=1 Tax=Polaribacter sp. SA4-10 TaxID=754397 RepID=UPI000B57C886|nr:DUF3244 domain-containing protein [Polaribacter sp. SA4-10]ARV08036.1 hypothetical protein BTO04_09225 [Polaribacter sp. SA4-10]
MKTTIKKSLVVVVFMLGTLINYANENVTSDNILDAKRVKVEFNAVKKGQTLTIKNNLGTTVYNQEIKTSGNYSRTFNLTALENGNYTAELDKDFEVIVKPFIVENGSVTFLEEKEGKVFKPLIRIEKELILISKIEFDNKPLKVTIYHENEILLSEKVEGENTLNRIYSLSKSPRGNYIIIINTNNSNYSKSFRI